MFILKVNYVKQAVDRAGGPTVVANKLKCSGTTIHSWIRKERVNNIEKAKILADLSGVSVKEIRPY